MIIVGAVKRRRRDTDTLAISETFSREVHIVPTCKTWEHIESIRYIAKFIREARSPHLA